MLAVFDRGDPVSFPRLCRLAENLGYDRVWLTEHRSPRSSASPTVLAAVGAAATKRIAFGTAGVMLGYRSPLMLAEEFRLLELLFPGRIDVGVIRGGEADELVHKSLMDGRPNEQNYEDRMRSLIRLLDSTTSDRHEELPLASPMSQRPRVWGCAMRGQSVQFAARHGIGLVYHRYLAHSLGYGDGEYLAALYRRMFTPSAHLQTPRVAVVCVGCCLETEAEASALWRRARGLPSDAPITVGAVERAGLDRGPDFLGTPDQCRKQLANVVETFGASEIAVHCAAFDEVSNMPWNFEIQARQYALLAQTFEMSISPTDLLGV